MTSNTLNRLEPTLTLNENEIHLWFCRIDQPINPALFDTCYSQLSDTEREQQSRFNFKKHRRQYLITRCMVRNILSLYTVAARPEQWQFTSNSYGKPRISAPIPELLHFNLSHTHDAIVLGITQEQEIGIDIESLSRKVNSLEIAERFFSQAETTELRSLPEHLQADRFYDLWTLKEAYIKACGGGLSLPLNGFGFQFHGEDITIEFSNKISDDPNSWKFWLLRSQEGHKVAVAIKGDSAEETFRISVKQIIPGERYSDIYWTTLRSSSQER